MGSDPRAATLSVPAASGQHCARPGAALLTAARRTVAPFLSMNLTPAPCNPRLVGRGGSPAGYSGTGKRITPAILPGASFEARFTPPRSGTFIYRTHIDEVRQQRAGLSGALLVLDDPKSYDPEYDVVLLITVPRKRADANVVLLNGSSTPAPRVMRAGQHRAAPGRHS
jgi:hypothetical protein